MAESGVITLDNFSDNGAKWSFYGSGGTTQSWAASADRAGTALGNTAGVRTLRYAFASTTGTDVSLHLTLPAPVDISAAAYFICDVLPEPVLAADITRLSVQLQTSGGNVTIAELAVQDGMWTYLRLPLAGLAGVDLTHVTGLTVILQIIAGTSGVVEIDTVRACDYVYSAADYAYYGRNSAALLPATAIAAGEVIRNYLFGSTTGVASGAAGYQGNPAAVNYGALTGWNQWTGQPAEVALDDESDHTYNTGHVIAALCLWYRMTSDPGYLAQASFLVQQYVERHYDAAAGNAKGFIAYAYDRNNAFQPETYPQTSTDQYQGIIYGLLEYFIVTGRTDAGVKQVLSDMQTWWDDQNRTDPNGLASLPSSQKPIIVDVAVAFADGGDSTSVDTTLTTELSSATYQASQQAYQLGWVGTQNVFYVLYSLLAYIEDGLRCRLRRSKVTFPVANLQAILQQNLLFAWGFGSNNYYATDMPVDFGKRPLGWMATEGVAWNGTTKQLQVTALGEGDQWPLSGAAYVGYLGPILQLLGGDVAALIAAGNPTAWSALSLMSEVLETYATATINNPSLAGTPVAGALPSYEIGPYGAYTGQVDTGRGGRMPLIDEQPSHLFFAAYSWWYLWTQFGGVWPSGAYDRVLDWQWQPGTLTLRLTANGTAGDVVSIPISGMAPGHTYVCKNETTGAQLLAAGGAYTLAWTLANAEETWLVYDLDQPPTKTLTSPAGVPAWQLAS